MPLISFNSAVNPAATSFELEHYFTIAEPSIIAVDSSQAQTVEKALSKLETKPPPQVILIDDGTGSVDRASALIVSSTNMMNAPN